MFGLSVFELLAIGALLVIGVALYARRNPSAQAALLNVLPDSGDQLLLQVQNALPVKAGLRAKLQTALDAANAKADEEATAYLKSRGYTVSKP